MSEPGPTSADSDRDVAALIAVIENPPFYPWPRGEALHRASDLVSRLQERGLTLARALAFVRRLHEEGALTICHRPDPDPGYWPDPPPRNTALFLLTSEERLREWLDRQGQVLAAAAPSPPAAPARHSSDFTSVHWFGADHTFSRTQAAVVRQLWEEWEKGTPELHQLTLLSEAESEMADKERPRLRDLFRGHAAWGSMIAPGTGKGTFRLKAPENS